MRFGSVPRRQHVDAHTHTHAHVHTVRYKRYSCREGGEEEEVRLDNEFEMRHRLIEYGMSMKLDLCRGGDRWPSRITRQFSRSFFLLLWTTARGWDSWIKQWFHGRGMGYRFHFVGKFEFLRIFRRMIDAYDSARFEVKKKKKVEGLFLNVFPCIIT